VNTVLQARPRHFVSTPTTERLARRALRYLQSGYSVHLKGPAGTGKTTLSLHLADLLGRPIMLLFGDDEFKTSDLIGNQSGYTRKKVVDNYIHSVVKVEDELRQNWVDSRLTLACREGFTLVYDEFNRSRPEVNNVLLSALEEKLLVLPPNQNRSEYIRVNPHFRAIFTSNPKEYCGVHSTQDALLDRLVTIAMPEPDELTQQQMLVQKTGLDSASALTVVQIVRSFHAAVAADMVFSLRPSLMIATICQQHGITVLAEDAEFRDVCSDVLLSRTQKTLAEATSCLWKIFNQHFAEQPAEQSAEHPVAAGQPPLESRFQPQRARLYGQADEPLAYVSHQIESPAAAQAPKVEVGVAESQGASLDRGDIDDAEAGKANALEPNSEETSIQTQIYAYVLGHGKANLMEIESELELNRFQVINALKSMLDQGLLKKTEQLGQPSLYHPLYAEVYP
jgi:gas vesicle protein GvpN